MALTDKQGHTKGPWVASVAHSGPTWRVESDAAGYPNEGWVIAADIFGPDAEANARLIASSPEMADFLAAFVTAYDESNPARMGDMHRPECKCIRCFRDRAEALHARATGAA